MMYVTDVPTASPPSPISLGDFIYLPEHPDEYDSLEVHEDITPYFPGKDLCDSFSLSKYNGNHLPHWSNDAVIYHVCFHLADSVPVQQQIEWLEARKRLSEVTIREHRGLTYEEQKQMQYLYSRKIEAFLDAGHGSCVLKNAEVAEVVKNALEFSNNKKYNLHAWCIMPNHVHIAFQLMDGISQREVLQSWKSFTSHVINKMLKRKGPFWQADSYNHIIRSQEEYYQQIRYIWNNPDKAGFKSWKWRWICMEVNDYWV